MAEIYFTVWLKEENVTPGVDYYIQHGESSEVVIRADGTVKTEFDGRWTTANTYMVLPSLTGNKIHTIPILFQ